MRILVVGDSYCPSSALAPAFAPLQDRHSVTFVDIRDEPLWRPSTASEATIKEYFGTPMQVISALDAHEVLVVHGAPITDAVLAAAPALELIGVARGGAVNVDIAAATARRMPVVTTPGKNATAVAELTIAFIIMLARRVPEAMRHVEAGGEYGKDNFEGGRWFGHEIHGRTLGIIGFGQVGRRVTTRAVALDMRVVAYDPFVPDATIRLAGAEPMGLDRLLGESDHVSLHARATSDNDRMMGASQFARMRRGSYFLNTARSALVEEEALVDALRSGHLAGAALDVASPSDAGSKHRLLQAAPNVVLVPHMGGSTHETLENGARMVAAEIERFAAGEPLLSVANSDVPQTAGGAS